MTKLLGRVAITSWHLLNLRGLAIYLLLLAPSYAADDPARPLVVIPGILGSKLCDSDDNVLWGNALSLLNLDKLDLSSRGPAIKVKQCGIIKQVQVLGPLWSVRAYTGLTEALADFGYKEGTNLYLFDYDWRKSNFDTAERLAAFVKTKIPEGQKFDILAHSMGGLVTRIYMKKLGKDARVHKVVYMGTPFLGSTNTFGTLSEGWGTIENALVGGKEAIRRTVLSFPGFLELLPRYSRCCYVRESNGGQRWIDPFNWEEWQKLGWLVTPHDTGSDLQQFKANLARAQSLTKILEGPAGNGVIEVRIAGDAHATRRLLGMPAQDTSPKGWLYIKDLGDGTVPVWSAAANSAFDSLEGTWQSFSEHATIFDDKWVRNQLRRELMLIPASKDMPIAGGTRPTIAADVNGSSTRWQVKTVEITPKRTSMKLGEQIEAEVVIALTDENGIAMNAYKPVASISGGDSVHTLSVTEITSENDLPQFRLRFLVQGDSARFPGIHELTLKVNDEMSAHAYIVVLPDNR